MKKKKNTIIYILQIYKYKKVVKNKSRVYKQNERKAERLEPIAKQ